jgi:hypothetical protein
MLIWLEVIYLVASFLVHTRSHVLGDRWRAVAHLKILAQRVTRRIEPAGYEDREVPGADREKGLVNGRVSTIRGVAGVQSRRGRNTDAG